MKIEFSEGDKGYAEAESILRLTRSLRATEASAKMSEELSRRAFEHLAGSDTETARMNAIIACERPSWVARAAAVWHRLWGPSGRELELSRQRGEALERADRAEHSSFEALAEMARVERERDAALEELASLRQRAARLDKSDGK